MANILLEDLQEIVSEISSARFSSQLVSGDAQRVGRVISCIVDTLDENKVKIDPDSAMLRTSEAIAVCGFLRTRYKGCYRDLSSFRKKAYSKACEDARSDLQTTGDKVTESRVSTLAELDDSYNERVVDENRYSELQDHLESLQFSLRVRLDVLIEISRNERANIKAQD